jgi:hypothetical protein
MHICEKPTVMHTVLRHLLPALMAPLLLASCGNEAGFNEAVFDSTTLREALNSPGSSGLRFYNARRNSEDRHGTVMTIAIMEPKGAEIRGFRDSDVAFRLSDAISGDRVLVRPLTAQEARRSCDYVTQSGDRSYAAEIGRKELENLLNVRGANGIRIKPRTVNDQLTMVFSPVVIADGRASAIANAPEFVCSEPCPMECGSSINYVNSAP